jgi:hypothetical protein
LSPKRHFSGSDEIRATLPLANPLSGGSAADAGFRFGWVIGVAVGVLLIVGSAVAVFAWKSCHGFEAPIEEPMNDLEAEVWIENPETLAEDSLFESVFVETNDETLFVRT